MRLDVVAGLFELLERELLGLALDLLHGEHVDRLSRTAKSTIRSTRARTELTFQVAKPHGIKPTASRRRGAGTSDVTSAAR